MQSVHTDAKNDLHVPSSSFPTVHFKVEFPGLTDFGWGCGECAGPLITTTEASFTPTYLVKLLGSPQLSLWFTLAASSFINRYWFTFLSFDSPDHVTKASSMPQQDSNQRRNTCVSHETI